MHRTRKFHRDAIRCVREQDMNLTILSAELQTCARRPPITFPRATSNRSDAIESEGLVTVQAP